MNVGRLITKEIWFRKVSFLLAVLSVTAAVGCLVGSQTLLKIHDIQTKAILDAKQQETEAELAKLDDEIRQAMLHLGLNVVIIPQDQDLEKWYANDFGSAYMPEEYVDRLANSKIATVRHLLPSLQQRVEWPETKRKIILVGTRGEVPNVHKNPKKPLVQPVPDGTIVLGHELHNSLNLKVGDKLKLMGREFTVHKCHKERGGKDDVTVWIPLKAAQELLDRKDQINAIMALECKCAWADIAKIRAELGKILPDTKIFEMGSKALARAEARQKVAGERTAALKREEAGRVRLRQEQEQMATLLVLLVMVAGGIWIAFLMFSNVRERLAEIGILRALGFRGTQIMTLFLTKSVVLGVLGGLLGCAAGLLVGIQFGGTLEGVDPKTLTAAALFEPQMAGIAMGMALALSILASWLPALHASRQDPASILSKE